MTSVQESTHTPSPGIATALNACPLCGDTRSSPWLRAPDRFHLRSVEYSLRRCSTCSLVRLDTSLPIANGSVHYGKAYDKSVETSGETNAAKRWRVPRERCISYAQGKGGNLLDIGCNTGAFLGVMKVEGWQLFGIEMSEEKARKAMQATGANVFIGDILEAPFAPQTFDVITGLHVLEHFCKPDVAMRKIRDWLRPGGVVYFQVPNIVAWEARIFRSYWYGLELPRHYFHFSVSSLGRLGESAGLEILTVSTLPDCYVEKSIRYIADRAVTRLGISRESLSEAVPAGIPWRVLRKAFRLGVLLPFRHVAAKMGRGAAIEVAFRKKIT